MSQPGVRFTTWISPKERRMIDELAKSENMSRNYIVRKAIREFLGLENHQSPQLLHVTNDTSTTEN